MKLKKQLSSLDGVEPKYHGLYKKVGDLYILQIDPADLQIEDGDDEAEDEDGVVDDRDPKDEDPPRKKQNEGSSREKELQRKLNEFRQNNIALRQENERMKGKLSNLDEDTINAALQALEQAENEQERELLSKGKINDAFNRRAQKIKAEYEAKIAAMNSELGKVRNRYESLRQDLKKTKIAESLRASADKLKIKPNSRALADLMNRGFSVFDIDEDGKIVAYDGDGEERTIKVNEDNRDYGPEDFLKALVEDAPHLFESAQGSDVRGSGGRGIRGTGVLEVDGNDPKAFGNNIDAIAKGKVEVRIK